MIKKHLFKNEILNDFEILINNKFGFDLKFSIKEMNQNYLNILDENIMYNLYDPVFSSRLLADYF